MYYNETFLRESLSTYLDHEGLSDVNEMNPESFAKWIFPQLVKHRRPLYQALADKYGYTITAQEAGQVKSEADLLELVELAIGRSGT